MTSTTDRLTRIGGAVFTVGVLFVVATIVPLLAGTKPLPLVGYLGTLLAPLGLGIALYGIWRTARERSRRTRAN